MTRNPITAQETRPRSEANPPQPDQPEHGGIEIRTEYQKIWQSMLEDCGAARSSIEFEQYLLQDLSENEIGGRFLRLFMDKAREGIRVRMIIDAVGSFSLFSDPAVHSELAQAGVELRFFGIVPRWRAAFPFGLFHRDHRKILVVDGKVAHVGGVVMWERSRDWGDITARITNPRYIREVKGAFLKMWDEIAETEENRRNYDTGNGTVIKSAPGKTDLYREILHRIHNAESRIFISTPYFSPNHRMVRALKNACKRGVEVNILIPEWGDSWFSSTATLSYLPALRNLKINTHLYSGCMNHGKFVSIDGWSTLGSMNFDRLSFFYNRELNIEIHDQPQLVDELIEKLKQSCRLTDPDYFASLSPLARINAHIGKLFRPLA